MGNKLKILLIIAPVLLFSCSSGDNYDSNTQISKYNNKNTDVFSDQKYQEIYTNLYLRLALEKSLDAEALNLFLSDMSLIKSDQLIEKLSSIAKASYRYEDLILISNYWIKINKNSYKAISYGFSASVELNKKNVAEDFYNNFVLLTNPKSNRDFARILFELQSNKNRNNVISFIDDLIEDNNSRQLRIAYIDLLYTFNLPHQVIENVNSIKIFNDRHLTRLYANSNFLIGNLDLARDALEKFLKDKKLTDRQVQLELAEVYLNLNSLDEATQVIDNLLVLTPNDSDLIYDISILLYESKFYEEAEKYLAKIVTNENRVDYLRGMLDLEKNNIDEAISHFDRVDNYSYKLPAMFAKSEAISKKNGYIDAITFLNSLDNLASKQDMIRVLMKKIEILRANEKYEEIVNLTREYLDNHNNDINVIYSRAMAYEAMGEIEKMETDLRNILKVDYENTNTLNALGYSLTIHTDRYAEALDMIERAYSHDPGNSAIIDSLAWVHYKLGNMNNALKYSKLAYEKDKDPEIIEHYCIILLKMGMLNEFEDVVIENERIPDNKKLIEKLKRLKSETSI